mmetsp:Transcript_2299/g.5383  ORF Transcript_2299/g.5383 Transcript_2299/m.5383 type:complete len:215 (+) Transcript_2299:1012-1656(+)
MLLSSLRCTGSLLSLVSSSKAAAFVRTAPAFFRPLASSRTAWAETRSSRSCESLISRTSSKRRTPSPSTSPCIMLLRASTRWQKRCGSTARRWSGRLPSSTTLTLRRLTSMISLWYLPTTTRVFARAYGRYRRPRCGRICEVSDISVDTPPSSHAPSGLGNVTSPHLSPHLTRSILVNSGSAGELWRVGSRARARAGAGAPTPHCWHIYFSSVP